MARDEIPEYVRCYSREPIVSYELLLVKAPLEAK